MALSKEKEKVDNYIITACITLLASYSIIFSIKRPGSSLISYLIIASGLCLLISLLESLWYKIRYSYRRQLFERKKRQIVSRYSDKIADFAEKIIIPYSILKFSRKIESNNKLFKKLRSGSKEDRKEAAMEVWNETEETTKEVLESYLKNLSNDMNEVYADFFTKPLEEKFARLKLWIDSLSDKTRYYFFTIGTFLFLISVFLNSLL